MEQFESELTRLPVSWLESLSKHAFSSLYALYDRYGHAMPLAAKYFRHEGRAALEAKKL